MDHAEDNEKEQLQAAEPIAQMFGMDNNSLPPTPASSGQPPSGLPIVEAELIQPASSASAHPHSDASTETIVTEEVIAEDIKHATQSSRAGGILKAVAPYLAIFAIGIFVYYYFLSSTNFSFSTLLPFKPTSKTAVAQTDKAKALAQLKKDRTEAYLTWIGQFFFDVKDSKIIDPDTDYSGNGLTNFQKYLLNLNPKVYDSIGKGYADGITVTNGLDPATAKPLQGERKDIVDKYFDTQEIRDRAGRANLNGGAGSVIFPSTSSAGQVAGATADPAPTSARGDSQVPAPATPGPSAAKATTAVAKAAAGPAYENVMGINTNIPGTLKIPKLGITAPLYFSKSIDAMYVDLKKGVAHLTGTPLPGDHGTSYLVGHSSGYVWDNSKYKTIFAPLNKLGAGDTFTITVTLTNGQQKVLTYKFSSSGLYTPDDQSQFVNYASSRVALSTCWPLNTTAKRLVVFADLMK